MAWVFFTITKITNAFESASKLVQIGAVRCNYFVIILLQEITKITKITKSLFFVITKLH